jgi:hypothetical protein
MRHRTAWILLMLAGAWASVQAQWLNYPTPGTPRTKDGRPNLSARVPRVNNGKPDLSGIWEAEPAPREELLRILPDGVNLLGEDPPSRYFLNLLSDFKPEESPLLPSLRSVFQQRAVVRGKDAPTAHCLPYGVPWADLAPVPFKIFHTAGVVLMIYEIDGSFRQIYTDGRKLPTDPSPSWMGYSIGRWEGDTLVVDSIGFNDRSWLDAVGHPHSEALHVTERFHRRDIGHMDLQITIDDPKSYSKPFTIKSNHRLVPDTDILEYFCSENEKDVKHMAGSQ